MRAAVRHAWTMVDLPEYAPIADIIEEFKRMGFAVSVHQDQPPKPPHVSPKLMNNWPDESTFLVRTSLGSSRPPVVRPRT
jgi:hypothetical protein